ncbi:MAG: 50S ribosomal protein L10 [Candidatus Aenigmatarchaeota archaeon]
MLKDEKPQEVEKLKKLIEEHSAVGILNMHKLPSKQLHKIKDGLRGKAVIRMSRKNLIKMALDSSGKDVKKLIENIKEEPALILSNENPFKLFKVLKDSRVKTKAKIGDIAVNDIIIPKGTTEIPPGPAISTLQKVGLKTSVQQGKIFVMSDKVATKAGEVINADVVNVLNLLKIEPMEVGLNMISVWESGFVYDKKILDIDVEDYKNRITQAVQGMINLSLNANYLVSETAELAIRKAFMEAKSLAIEANIIEREFIGDLLAKAVAEAKSLESALK